MTDDRTPEPASDAVRRLYELVVDYVQRSEAAEAELIRAFEKQTGVPVLLNTSFNENEPIVDTPAQAIDCFLRTNMDGLAIGSFLVLKPANEDIPSRSEDAVVVPVD